MKTCTFAPQSSTARPANVGRPQGAGFDLLPLQHMGERIEPVAVDRGALEILSLRGLAHGLAQSRHHLGLAPAQEVHHLIDDGPVLRRVRAAHAGSGTAVDVELQAGRARRPSRLAPPAGPHREHPAEHVEGVPDLGRACVWPEVQVATPVRLAREDHSRILVLHGDHDVGVGLVVAKPDVEGRPVLLDEVVLEQQRLDLVGGHDPLESRGPTHHFPLLRAHPHAFGAHRRGQVVGQAPAKRKRFPDVEDVG